MLNKKNPESDKKQRRVEKKPHFVITFEHELNDRVCGKNIYNTNTSIRMAVCLIYDE